MLIHWSKITPRFCTDLLGVIEDAPCNAGLFRDLTQSDDAKYILFLYYQLVLEYFESSIAEYQQYNVLNSSRKRSLTHYQDPMIYTAVCHQHTSDI